MKRILLFIMAIGILLLGACGGGATLTHYVNQEYGYSIDYPSDWLREDLADNEVGIKPADAPYNQIQITAFPGQPIIGTLPDETIASSNESSLQALAKDLGATDLEITVNQRAEGKWDWEVNFSLTSEGTPLQGGLFILETPTVSFTVFFIQSEEWPEGQEVIDSFSPTGINTTEETNGN
jgi:hypothetical protein